MGQFTRTFLILNLFISGIIFPQTRTNLEVFYGLMDSSVTVLPEELPSGSSVFISSGSSITFNYLFEKFNSRYPGVRINESGFKLSFAVEEINLKYGEVFRKSFMGDYFIERNFVYSGNFVLPDEGIKKDFLFVYSDTVEYDKLKSLENENYPFTKADIPSEPFLSGLMEPVIAIGVAVTAVVLFFVIRSE